MATIKNSELIPKSDLDALDAVYAKIGKASERTLEWGGTLQGLATEFSKVNVNYKQLTDLINKYEKVVEEANSADAERVRLMNEAAKLEAKIAAANSEEAKRVRELRNEYASINREIDANIKNKKAQSETIVEINKNTGDSARITEEERAAIERSNQAFAEKGKSLSELAAWQESNQAATENSTEAVKIEASTQSAAQSAFDTLTESIQMQTQGLIEMKLERDQVREQMKGLTKDYQDGNVTHDAYILRTAELMALERDLSVAIDTTANKIKYETQIATTAVGSYENLTAQYSLMKIEINALGEAEGKNAEHKRALEAQAKSLYETMDQLQRATGKHQLNVGNYDAAVADLTRTVGLLDPKLGMIIRKVQNIPTLKKAWISVNNQLIKSLGLSAKAATALQFALVGLVVGGILLAIAHFKKLRDEQKLISEVNKGANATYAEQYATIKKLQGEWTALGGNMQAKTKFVKENKTAFEQLGIEVKEVNDAENVLVKNTGSVLKALQLRAQASALQESATDSYKKAFDTLEDAPKDLSDVFFSLFNPENWDNAIKSFYGGGSALIKYVTSFGEEAGKGIDRADKYIAMASELNAEARKLEEEAGIKRKGTGATDKEISKANKLRRDELKAIADYYNFIIAADAAAQNKIATDSNRIQGKVISDEENWYNTRISALDSFLELQAGAIEATAVSDIEAAKLRFEQGEITEENLAHTILLINAKKNVELGKITEDGEQMRYGIALDYANRQIKAVSDASSLRVAMTTEAESEALKNLSAQYLKGEINEREYEEGKLKITQEYAEKRMQIAIDSMREQLALLPLDSEQRKQLELEIARAEIDINNWKNEQISQSNEKSLAERKDMNKQYIEQAKAMFSEMINFISALVSAHTQKELKELEKRQEAAQESHEKETDAIQRLEDAGAISKEQANARKALADQKLREEEEKIEQEKAEVQKRQAKFDKAVAVTNSLINTAAAVVAAWTNPYAAPFIIPMILATGAIQLATILATPIPEYAAGTDSHKGGPAIVGDGYRPEMVIYGGKYFKTPAVPTLVDLPRGAKVLPDWDAAVMSMAFTPISKWGSDYEKQTPFDDSNIIEGFDRTKGSIDKFMSSYNREKKNRSFDAFKYNKNHKLN